MIELNAREEELLVKVLDGSPSRADLEAFTAAKRQNPELEAAFERSRAIETAARGLPLSEPGRDLVGAAQMQLRRRARPAWAQLRIALPVGFAIAASAMALVLLLPSEPAEPLQIAAKPVPAWSVSSVEGAVTVFREGRALETHDALLLIAGDSLEAHDGKLTLRRGTVEVTIFGNSKVSVAAGETAALVYERGAVSGSTRDDKLRIALAATGDAVQAVEASFAMLGVAADRVTVAARRGSLKVQGAHSFTIAAEYEATRAGGSWSPARATAAQLELTVSQTPSPAGEISVSGRTNPGAIVMVDGEVIELTVDGRFEARLPMPEERRPVLISVRDAIGRKKQESIALAPMLRKKKTAPRKRPAKPKDSDWDVGWDEGTPG